MSKMTRRDFINGAAVTVVSATGLGGCSETDPILSSAAGESVTQPYPPELTGMRGSNDGSFETFHNMSWQGDDQWARPKSQTDDPYDLVVVGAGFSGLATAWFYRKRKPDAKILILDNHDDFGGHARRNEFNVDGHFLIGHGGSTGLTYPDSFSDAGMEMLRAVGVQWEKFLDGTYYDEGWYERHNVAREGLFFGKDHYEKGVLCLDPLGYAGTAMSPEELRVSLDQLPLQEETRNKLYVLVTNEPEILPGLTLDQKKQRLSEISYLDYLRDELGVPEDGLALLRAYGGAIASTGVGYDVVAADVAASYHQIGLRGIEIKRPLTAVPKSPGDLPFVCIYPDGNATIARLIVRDLIPKVAPGVAANDQDILLARLKYENLDQPDQDIRLRLNSSVVNVEHTTDRNAVDVTYVNGVTAFRVKASHAIMANWNQTIPYICPELGEEQKSALADQQKAPMAYARVALRNWRSLANAGFSGLTCPRSFYDFIAFPNPVHIGDYSSPMTPNEPIVLEAYHFAKLAEAPGLSPKEQYRLARYSLLNKPLEEYEQAFVEQMTEMFGSYGFDPETIAGFSLNRWPHGYAPTWNSLYDKGDHADSAVATHVIGRQKIGRISIANSDSEGRPVVQAAVTAAYRAVREQVG